MSSNTFTVKTTVQSAQPRSKRLRGLAGDVVVGSGSAGGVAGSVGEGHSHANKSLLDSLMSDEEGYLYIVGKTEDSDDSIAAKILAGSADKWAGHAWEEYMDQPLRSSDDVTFASVAVEKVVFTNGAVLEVDGDRIKINKVLYSTKNLAVLGEGEDVPGGGGSGASYNRLDTWDGYNNSTMAGYVLSAALGYDINTRLTTLENSGLTGDYLPSTTKYALSDKVGGNAMALHDYVSENDSLFGNPNAGLRWNSLELTEDEAGCCSYIPVFSDDLAEPIILPMHKTNVLKMLGFKVMSDGKPALSKKCSLWGNDFDGTADVNGRLSIEPETDGSVISIGNGYGDEGGGIFTYSYGGDEVKRVIFLYAGTSQDQGGLDFTQGIALYDNGKIRLNAAPGFAVFDNSPTEDIEMWGTFGGNLTKIKFSNGATIEVDGDYLKVTSVLYSTKNLAVLGEGEDVPGGGGGSSYTRLDSWDGYDNSTMAGYVLSAALGYDINTRLTTLENSGLTGDYLPSTTKYALSDKVGGDAMALYDYNRTTQTSDTVPFIGGLSYSNAALDETEAYHSSYIPVFYDDSEPMIQPMHKTNVLKMLGFTVGTDGKPVVGGDITDSLLTSWGDYSPAKDNTYALGAGLGYQLYEKAHTHDNKSVLDTITSSMISKWNNDYLPKTTKYALSDAVGGNALYANRLTRSRKISLSGAVQSNGEYFNGSSDISIPVNYIYDDFIREDDIARNNNVLNPLTKLYLNELKANLLAFVNPEAISWQYTRDNGVTWTDYYPRTNQGEINVDNAWKTRLISGLNYNLTSFYRLGKATQYLDSFNQHQLKIEIDTMKIGADMRLLFFVVYIGVNGGNNLYVTIDKRHTESDAWENVRNKIKVIGEPGYNKINLPAGGLRTDPKGIGSSTSNTFRYRYIRIILTQEYANLMQTAGCVIYNLYAFGNVFSGTTNIMKTGMLYDYDEYQNMKLPAGIIFSNGCSISVDGDKLKVHGTIYSDSNVAVKTE